MAITHLSFGSFVKLHNNTIGTVSPIGEISGRSMTFVDDPAKFANTIPGECVLYNFLSRDGNTNIVMSDAVATAQLAVAEWLYAEAVKGNINNNSTATLNALRTQFTQNITFDAVGVMVTNSAVWMPSLVRGFHTVNGVQQAFYLWFADEYFDEQYPEVTIRISHPVELTDIDSLYELNYQQLAARLALETPDVVSAREKRIAPKPLTERNILSFLIYDLINIPHAVRAYWSALINGNYNEDLTNQQIREEILANSKYNETQWGEKIPDLFNPNEFYCIPRFDLIGLVNKTDATSTYSPIVDHETEFKFVDKYLTPNMTADHVIKSTQTLPRLYKSLQTTVTAKINNREGFIKLSDVYPDYQLIPATDSDHKRMSLPTRNFITTMDMLLSAAEVVTEFTIPPAGVTTVKRFDKLWVTAKTGDVKFMVLTRYQMEQDGNL